MFHDGVEIARDDAVDGWSVVAGTFPNGESSNAKVVTEGSGWFGVTVDIVGRRRPARADQFADGRGVPVVDPKTGATAFTVEAAMRFLGEVKSAPPAQGRPAAWRQR